MEEERLVLLKEHKESTARITEMQTEKDELTQRNAELTAKVEMFEKELLTLRDEFKESKEQMLKEQEKAAAAAEKAANRIQGRRPLSKAANSSSTNTSITKKPTTLKFKQDGAQAQSSVPKGDCENCKQTK